MTTSTHNTLLLTIKARIWKLCKQSLINVHVAADKAKVRLPLLSVEDCNAVLKVLTKPRRITPPVPNWVKDRYNEAHKLWSVKEHPNCVKDGFYCEPVFPPVHKSGGLTKFIVNYATWCGCYGNRINTTGRKIYDQKKKKDVWITGTTKKGTGDIILCMPGGKMLWLEVKIGNDTPSDKQLREQRRVRSAGGEYLFVKTAQQYLDIFDGYKYGS